MEPLKYADVFSITCHIPNEGRGIINELLVWLSNIRKLGLTIWIMVFCCIDLANCIARFISAWRQFSTRLHQKTPDDTFLSKNMFDRSSENSLLNWHHPHAQLTLITRDNSALLAMHNIYAATLYILKI